MKETIVALSALTAVSVQATFTLDRSVMSEEYWKIWNDDAQRRIDADIEKYRKADGVFAVDAPDGAEVKAEQLTHAFFFGAHIFNFGQLGTKERNARYKALYGKEGALFNSATVAFYWRAFERFPGKPRFEAAPEDSEEFWNNCPNPKEQPHWRRPPTDPVIDYLTSRGCRIHGHPLVWGNNTWMTPNWLWDELCPEAEKAALEKASGVKIPRWNASIPAGAPARKVDRAWERAWAQIYKKLTGEQIAALVPTFLKAQNECYERRIRQIGERYGARVHSWDVVNESATDFDRFGRKAVRNRPFDGSHYGPMPADYAYKAFVWAGKYLPKNAWFNLNDYNMGDGFFLQARDLVAHGARIDVVGSQMHLFNPKESLKIMAGKGPTHRRALRPRLEGGPPHPPLRDHHHRARQLAEGADGPGDHHAQLLPRVVRSGEDERYHVVERGGRLRRAGRALDQRTLHARHAAEDGVLRDGRPRQPRVEDEDHGEGAGRQGVVPRFPRRLPPDLEGR